jgi:hypothetical protein
MTFHRLALPVLALALGTSGMLMAKSGLSQGNPVQDEGRSHDQDRGGWDAPPGELREVQRRGFHDGLDAGKEDAEHHHHNMENRGYIAIPRFNRESATATVTASAAATKQQFLITAETTIGIMIGSRC